MTDPHHVWLILGAIGIAQLVVVFGVAIVPDRVRRSRRVRRVDDSARERSSQLATGFGLRAAVAAPISVNAPVWGMLTATSSQRPLPAGIEHRSQQAAKLAGSAFADAESRAVTASCAYVAATADETRRQLLRDLHDGAQQRLVHSIITLKLAKAELADSGGRAAELVDEALLHAERATAELRDLVCGMLPPALIHGGLRAGVESLLDHLSLPVEANLDVPRLPAHVETAAYFVIAEALTNVVKHAHATKAQVSAVVTDDALLIEVQDDGRGGADAAKGSGVVGLFDRVQAAAGTVSLSSRSGQGTKISAALPLGDPESRLAVTTGARTGHDRRVLAHRGAQTAAPEWVGHYAVSELAKRGIRPLRVFECLIQEPDHWTGRPAEFPSRQLQRDHRAHQTLLRSVV